MWHLHRFEPNKQEVPVSTCSKSYNAKELDIRATPILIPPIMNKKDVIQALLEKGVTIPDPNQVYIDSEVSVDRISGTEVVIHPGCRISGRETLIMDGVKLGYEAPVTVEDCQLGPDVELKGG